MWTLFDSKGNDTGSKGSRGSSEGEFKVIFSDMNGPSQLPSFLDMVYATSHIKRLRWQGQGVAQQQTVSSLEIVHGGY